MGYIVKNWVWGSKAWDLGLGVSHRLRLFRIFRYRFDLFVFIDGLLDNSLRCNQLESSPPELALQDKMS